MKLSDRGYTPRISGRPASDVVDVAFPRTVCIDLRRGGSTYAALVREGDAVAAGDSLAEVEGVGGSLGLPSPVSGKVVGFEDENSRIVIETDGEESDEAVFEPLKSQFAAAAQVRNALSCGGLWPCLWSSATGAAPAIDGSERPKRVIVSLVAAEPYHARGRVVLTRHWDDVMSGIRFLPRLMDDYGRVEVILTAVRDPVARKIYRELAGFAWVRLHPVAVRYPVGDPRMLVRTLSAAETPPKPDEIIWVMNAQSSALFGRVLGRGLVPRRRLIVLAGPGVSEPKHYSVPIGTRLRDFAPAELGGADMLLLRGGLLRGAETDFAATSVQIDDDAFFALPKPVTRQAFSFLRPGFDRRSIFPAFAGSALNRPDSHITASLRGEERPCISCGACERVCPVRIIPQVLHRYLYRDRFEEAERAGLNKCIDCNLCTFVCPSKIALQEQFETARAQIRAERLALEKAVRADGELS